MEVRITCKSCDGTGLNPSPVERFGENGEPIEINTDCSFCSAVGYFTNSIELPTNVFWSYEILEAINTSEYADLSDAQKEGVKLLLSCTLVDLNDGKAGKVRLWSWFGEESTTVDNLQQLLS